MSASEEINYPVTIEAVPTDYEYYEDIKTAYRRAYTYLDEFRWCSKIYGTDLYYNLSSKLSVFLFHLENTSSKNKDNYLWVIVGDLPSMYLDIHEVWSLKEALLNYIDLADEWQDNIMNNKSIEDCYPFEAEPTRELATMLKKRIDFIRDRLLDEIDDVELETGKE